MRILAIETSCDETAASIIEKSGKDVRILSNVIASQIEIHRKFGGVFPEHASRAHAEKIIPVVEEALGKNDPDIIAVTTGPGLIGSLLIGVNFAKTYAYAKNLPIIGINHWLGHIYSCFVGEKVININSESGVIDSDLSSDNKSQLITRSKSLNHNLPSFPSLILIVSGGHTGLVLMKSHNEIIPLGETLDDAAGEAFDKVAKLLQLGYPGGPAIAEAAAKFSISNFQFPNKSQITNFKFPRSMLDKENFDFSFSGLKTAVLYKIREFQSQKITINHSVKSLIACEFQQAVIDILVGKTIQAAYQFRPKSICLCGGVSANRELRQQLKLAVEKLPSKPSYHIPPMELTTDNAAMIGIAASYHLDKLTTWNNIHANANLKI